MTILTIILILIALAGIVLQYKIDHQVGDDIKKRRYGSYLMAVSLVGVIGSNVIQYKSGEDLENDNNRLDSINNQLILKLDTCNSSITNVKNDLTLSMRQMDSVLLTNKILNLNLNSASQNIQRLSLKTDEGFKANQKSIGNITIEGKKPRSLSEDLQRLMITELSRFKGANIKFKTVNTSQEALSLSKELQSVFKTAGWIVEDERILVPNSSNIGILLLIHPDNDRSPSAILIYDLVKKSNLKFEARAMNNFSVNQIELHVGFQE